MDRATMAWVVLALSLGPDAGALDPVSFHREESKLRITVRGRPFAEYVWSHPVVRRPFFADLCAADGTRLTRRFPPAEGLDATDHATMHPGLWMAFGDLSGHDFWRNKGTVEHGGFSEPPQSDSKGGRFQVTNRYLAAGKLVCEEQCRIQILPRPEGVLIDWTSLFSGPEELSFGDQEEMGLGFRVATELAVTKGGSIRSSAGGRDEKGVWGKEAAWCEYSRAIEGKKRAGLLLMTHPENFRSAWFHARDYGLLVANPFGRHALTKGPPSRIVVRRGESLCLRFGILAFWDELDAEAAFGGWLKPSRAAVDEEPR
jgi:hypothetical protein